MKHTTNKKKKQNKWLKPDLTREQLNKLLADGKVTQQEYDNYRKKRKRMAIAQFERAKSIAEPLRESNPFWFYKPSDGKISDRAWEILKKHLKPEDIPQEPLFSQVDLHSSDKDITIAMCGNQWGKSIGEVITANMWATGDVPASLENIVPKSMLPTEFPTYIRLNTVDKELLNENILPKFMEHVPKERLLQGSWEKSYSAQHCNLSLYGNGKVISNIQFKTYKQDVASFQGVKLDGLLNDEQPPQDIQKENEKRFRTAKRMKQLWACTPTLGMTPWVYDMLQQDNVFWFNSPSVVNSYINLDIIDKELEEENNYEAIKTTLLGIMTSLSGFIYMGLWNPKIHLIEPFEIDHDNYIVYRGLDPHTSKPSVWVNVAVDREGNKIVCGAGEISGDNQDLKDVMAKQASDREYRLGRTVVDQWVNTTNKLVDVNVFRELRIGKNCIPALWCSRKSQTVKNAGVSEIKKCLRPNEISKKPTLYMFNIPELRPLFKSMATIERDRASNEDVTGKRDKIQEGPHDYHAALRYAFQTKLSWYPPHESVPEREPIDEVVNY